MAKNFVSNSTESTRMFKSSLLESLSKVHFAVPLFIFIPAIAIFIYRAFGIYHVSFLYFLGYFALGIFIWTLTEYVLHRFIFHFHPSSSWGKRIHFIFHGVHHDYPRDKKRLVMPPSVSIPLALLFYYIFYLILPNGGALSSFFAAFLAGYLAYDMMHYAMHHHNFKSPLMKRIKQHHMLHHYQDEHKGFGVSSALWDKIFVSGFPKKKQRATESSK